MICYRVQMIIVAYRYMASILLCPFQSRYHALLRPEAAQQGMPSAAL